MPETVQFVVDRGFAYAEPKLTWARSRASLLDATAARLEKYAQVYAPSAIETADKYLDMALDAAAEKRLRVRAAVAAHAAALEMAKSNLAERAGVLAERAECIIDRFLPLPPAEDAPSDEDDCAMERFELRRPTLVPRLLHLPRVLPARVCAFVRTTDSMKTITVFWQETSELASEQQALLQDKLKDGRGRLSGAFGSASHPIVGGIWTQTQGAREWTQVRVGQVVQVGAGTACVMLHHSRALVARLAGEDVASLLAARLSEHLPFAEQVFGASAAEGKEVAEAMCSPGAQEPGTAEPVLTAGGEQAPSGNSEE